MKKLTALAILVWVTGCSESPTSPTNLTTRTVTGNASSWTVSGTAWVYDGPAKRRVTSGHIYGWIDFDGSAQTTGPVPIQPDGTYSFSVPTNTARVYINPGTPGYQPCLMTASMRGNLSFDPIYVSDISQLGANLPQELLDRGPTLSGVVYEQTADGRRPVPNAWVGLDGLAGNDLIVGTTLTDAAGRYVFCNISNLPLLSIQAGADGFEAFYSEPGVGKSTSLDVELKRK